MRDDEPLLPPTVVAGHLASCAAELARGPAGTAGELAAAIDRLSSAQHDLTAAIGDMAERLRQHPLGTNPEVSALAEILAAAAGAVGYAAEALDEAGPLATTLLRMADEDTRL
ncbi:hypothetical protein [Amycolatopsis suaedae]|uniref:Uncharacterized protein n=1 Tax=Amycolatopsis suaedae TaxID=2510978 RepID=A0A4Q7JAF3_9PSEU|nr:hypothetical protein [Amycolatopsis suaedae]RZQ64790.1 hypothetical protein EWH70_07845 [Amycolatopsis suaedae]